MIEQLRVELHAATDRMAKLQPEADESRDAAARIEGLEDLLAQYQETVADQEQTIQNMAADNALLKRSLFGSRRERFVDDPSQQLLFDPASLDSPAPEKENEQPPEAKKKYPILGRKAWLFFGNQSAGETAAKLFTLTKTCNRLRIDPFTYLQDVYTRLPKMSLDELPQLLPDHWIKDHPQHLIQQCAQEALDRAQRARERRAERRRAA